MKNSTSEEVLKRIDEVKARDLVTSLVNAAKEQVEYVRASNAAKRAVILSGKRDAGQIHESNARRHYENRNSQLRRVKNLSAEFLANMDENQKKNCAESLERGGLNELAAYARQAVIQRLSSSDIRPADAQTALKQLDTTLEKLKGLTSLKETHNYLQQHLDELIKKKMGNPGSEVPWWCIWILIITSLWTVIVLLAFIVCVAAWGWDCRKILDYLMIKACY